MPVPRIYWSFVVNAANEERGVFEDCDLSRVVGRKTKAAAWEFTVSRKAANSEEQRLDTLDILSISQLITKVQQCYAWLALGGVSESKIKRLYEYGLLTRWTYCQTGTQLVIKV
jgi:hypothetical protein